MRGRKPAGPDYLDQLDGSSLAKERGKVVLDTVKGKCSVAEACRRLGISEPRFYQLRVEMLQAALAALEPGTPGRPARAATPEQQQIAVLEQTVARLQTQLRAAQVQEEIALALPMVQKPATEPIALGEQDDQDDQDDQDAQDAQDDQDAQTDQPEQGSKKKTRRRPSPRKRRRQQQSARE
jgi:hypothetical protein